MANREIFLWCPTCEKPKGSLCEVDEHQAFWASRPIGEVTVTNAREEDVEHVCSTCFMEPGSDSARAAGCICAVLDNSRGHDMWLSYSLDCPVHGLGESDG